MSKELVIGSNRHETKVAVLEDDQLVEVYFQRGNEYSLAGSIHKGRVTRVLPGMQSAFVDLGLERDTFLYVSDFFEENEDIDTVSEEKTTRPERRDRNGNRGGSFERRPIARPVLATQEPVTNVAPTVESPEDSEIEDEPPVAPVQLTPATEDSDSRAPEQSGDRGLGGDRRGRRSRRRRQRGRGFPENKYAQPVGSGVQPALETRSAPETAEHAPSDVIVLPGESLAKYRNITSGTGSPESQGEPQPAQEPDTGYGDAGADSESFNEDATEEELAEEAEEIALADMILAHHDNESPEAEEEKIREVETDVPEPDAKDERTLESRQAEPVSPAFRSEFATPEPPEFEPLAMPGRHEPSDAPGLESPTSLDRYEVLAIEEGFTEADEPSVEEEEAQGEALADAPGAGATIESDESGPGSGRAQAQTATVREQGDRYMHRVSRRMRRRRGGNRFGPQPQPQNEFGEPGRVESAGSGAGAGVALAPEARTEPTRERAEERTAEKPERMYPSISELLKPGQEIIVQIAKEPLGQKGARITSHIALPGRYVVFMPSVGHLGVSRKVASDEERQRLKKILQAHRPGTSGGFIVRTAGEGVPEEEIAADMNFLYSLWLDIRQKAEKKPAPALLHYDLDVVQRILRDQVTDEFKAIWVDNEDLYESVLTFMQRFQPALVNRVKMYTRQAPIFDAFNITQELEKALRPKVWLKSGGYIVINQTEALVAIDINTGKYVGKSNRLEDTIVKTNTEAVKEIVRQIRLRDLGGIIVVDFIDMDERKNRQKVMQALEEAMRADKAPYKILQFNDFGLVAITRKRVKQSLERTLCSPCPYCEGAGYVKSVQTVISEILVEAQKISRAIEGNDVVLRVHPDVAKVLKASDNRYLEELEDILKRPVLVTGDPTLHHQKFDLA